MVIQITYIFLLPCYKSEVPSEGCDLLRLLYIAYSIEDLNYIPKKMSIHPMH